MCMLNKSKKKDGDNMPLQIIRNDITKVKCDAIVNAANSTLLGGGGVDGAIHRAAGKKLLAECMKLHGCKVGEAKITNGYNLPSKYVIHTVGPKWHGGNNNEKAMLENCYRNSLLLAKENKCDSIAFPLISSGVYGYPMEQAFRVAMDTITEFLDKNDMLVYIVVYDRNAVSIGEELYCSITQYIDDNYVEEHKSYGYRNFDTLQSDISIPMQTNTYEDVRSVPLDDKFLCEEPADTTANLSEIVDMLDESFSQMLIRKIDQRGMKDSECYKRANIDRKLFSKIRSNPQYKPSKPTVIAFCIALELSLEETNEMLLKAGFALSHSNKFDVIIEYFIKKGNYNIFEINEALFYFDQNLLGA